MDLRSALESMLGNDNSVRVQAEDFFYKSLSSAPGPAMLNLISLIESSPQHIQQLISLMLKQLVDPLSSKETWSKLDPQSQNTIKSSFLSVLALELEPKPSELFCEVIGILACQIYSSKAKWPELILFIKSNMFTVNAIKCLTIASMIYIYTHDEIRITPDIFQGFLTNDSLLLKVASVKALNSVLGVMKKKLTLHYSSLIPILLSAVYAITCKGEYYGVKTLEYLREIIENKAFLFTDHLQILYDFSFSLLKCQLSTSTKLLSCELLICLYEGTSEIDTSLCQVLIREIFIVMVSNESLSDESWESPEEGFAEFDGIEIDYAKSGRKLINRLIEAVGEAILLDPALKLIQQGLEDPDWRGQYSALATLGELIPFIAEPSKISEILPIVTNACSSSNQKVRFAGFLLILDLSQHYVQEFQAAYHGKVFPIIINGCHDQVPRIRAQALAAATGFIEGAGFKISSLYISSIPFLISLLYNQPSIVIEYAVTAISAFAKSGKTALAQYYQDIIDELLKLLHRAQHKVYENLRARTVECISLSSAAVGKQLFITKIQEGRGSFNKNSHTLH